MNKRNLLKCNKYCDIYFYKNYYSLTFMDYGLEN